MRAGARVCPSIIVLLPPRWDDLEPEIGRGYSGGCGETRGIISMCLKKKEEKKEIIKQVILHSSIRETSEACGGSGLMGV